MHATLCIIGTIIKMYPLNIYLRRYVELSFYVDLLHSELTF